MTTIETVTTTVDLPTDEFVIDEAQLAAVAFLARYSGRTLDAYRHDLRGFFQWAADGELTVLAATRPNIELYRSWMEDRGLAASTIDRRLSTVCGFYRFAHIDGRIASNPAQYVRRPQVHPSNARGLDRSELAVFLFTAEQYDREHAALAVLLGLNGLRVSEACATNIEDPASNGATGRSAFSARATSRPRSRWSPVRLARSTWQSANVARDQSCAAAMDSGSIGVPPTAGSARSASAPAWGQCTLTCCERRSSWPPSTPASPCATCRSPLATPTPERPRSTTGAARTSTAMRPTSSWRSWPEAGHPRSDRWRLDPLDRVHPVDGPVKGSDLADPGALGARDEVCLGEVDAVGLVHLDSPEKQRRIHAHDRVERDQRSHR